MLEVSGLDRVGDQHADDGSLPAHAEDKIRTYRRRRRGNVIKLYPSIILGSFAALLTATAIPASMTQVNPSVSASPAPSSAPTVRSTSYYADAMSSGVDCIGDGASCEGFLQGSNGKVTVTNNPHHRWHFELTCDFGGDQIGDEKPPSIGPVSSFLTCKYGALAKYWNVLVD